MCVSFVCTNIDRIIGLKNNNIGKTIGYLLTKSELKIKPYNGSSTVFRTFYLVKFSLKLLKIFP